MVWGQARASRSLSSLKFELLTQLDAIVYEAAARVGLGVASGIGE